MPAFGGACSRWSVRMRRSVASPFSCDRTVVPSLSSRLCDCTIGWLPRHRLLRIAVRLPEERQEQKVYAKLADSFTPLSKGMNSEYANQNAYDCIQIHGGSGFMMEYACQRIYRDARITSIYEGTTQLQTVAAIRYVTNGSYIATLRNYEEIGRASCRERV